MRSNKNLLLTLLMMIVIAALYRVIPDRQPGFAPHWALALFGGAAIRDRRFAFALPIFSMFISDVIYQLLYINGMTDIPGFYSGQFTNYLLFAGVTLIGFLMKRITVINVVLYSFAVCTVFYLLSNFFVWNSGGGWGRPHTFAGMIQAYIDGLPFYGVSIAATLVFSAILFSAWKLITTGFKPLVNQ